jgi:predicted nucleic acid-binding protein
MIILDTNVVSEQIKSDPSEAVIRWAATVPSSQLFTTAVTEAEMLIGLEMMPQGRRRTVLADQIGQIFDRELSDKILPFDRGAARELSKLPLPRTRDGKPIINTDALIGAIALAHGAVVATRNVKDFRSLGIDVVNPWTDRQ